MAYTINKTDGTIFQVVADGTINTDSSLVLVGKNYAGYGEFQNENFIKLLENGANATPPATPLVGQLWYDKAGNLLKVYNGSVFKVISGATAAATQPTSNVAGDLWFDTLNGQLKVYNGASFTLIGPAFTSTEGTSGIEVTTITDSSPGSDHVIVKILVNNVIVAIVSKDPTFTPAVSIPGFTTINPGMNLSSTVSGAKFVGTATNSDLLGNVALSGFVRTDNGPQYINGALYVNDDASLFLGEDSDLKLSVVLNDTIVENVTASGNLHLRVNATTGGAANVITISGSTGDVAIAKSVAITGNISATGNAGITGNAVVTGNISGAHISASGTLAATGNITGGNLTVGTGTVSVGNIVNNNANGVGNIGSSSLYFNTVFAKSTSAQYADLAERFAADAEYPVGTVVELGGSKEVTVAVTELSETILGVISTAPAYLMNNEIGTDASFPPIALAGRVPVRVVGTVSKGDRLVCAGNGVARKGVTSELTAFNVIGRSLEDKTTDGEGTVEAIVMVK